MTYCNHSNQPKHPFILPELPYGKDDFKPYFTAETFEYHYNKHHNAYVTNLNNLIKDNKEMIGMDLETIILSSNNSNPAIFNNSAQVWNHTFFWHSINPKGGGEPKGEILMQIEKDFSSYELFVTEFKQAALSQFGSGWVWLVYKNDKLEIIKTSNAATPMTDSYAPILACDVWEHAYYIDYRNRRPDYINDFIDHMINWEFAELQFIKARKY